MNTKEWLLLITLALIWGGSFFFAEVALRDLGPLTVVLGRVGLAALALIGFVYATGKRMPGSWRIWAAFLAMGALNNVIPFSLIVWGQVHITGGLASILNATTPLFTVLLAHFLTRDERITAGKLTGVGLGVVGVAVLIGPEALAGLGVGGWAQLAILGAAISYSFAAIFGRRFRSLPPAVTAAGQVTASTLFMLPLALTIERPWEATPDAWTWSAVLAIALLSTALAYIIYFRILSTAGATNLMLVTLLVPVSAILLGTLILGEAFGWQSALGMGLIGLGLVAVDGRLPARLWRLTSRPQPGPG